MSEEKIQTLFPTKGVSKESASQFHDDEIAVYWLSALIDSAEDAIISKTLDGIITSWNTGAERIFGYTAEEIIGKPVLILIPPDRHKEEKEVLAKIKAGQRVEHYETIRLRKDGSAVDISLTVSPIKRPDGKIIGVSKVARDITNLKQSKTALRDSRNQLRLITDALPVLISYVDKKQCYRFVNRGYRDWFGLPSENLIGKHIREVLGEVAYLSVLPKIERVLAGEEVTFEQQIPYPGDNMRFTWVAYVPDIDPLTGEVNGFCALVQDISESKRAEVRLRESEERFAKAFKASPLALTISSLETGKLLEVNETFVDVTGFSREEAIGHTTLELGLWAKPLDREQEMATVRQSGKIRNAEYSFRVRDGREIIGLLSAEHIEIGGESFALTVIEDITDRKRAEAEREKIYERFRLAEIASNGFIYEWSLATGLVEPSKRVTEVLGYQPEELSRETGIWRRLIHPDDLVAVLAAFQEIATARATTYKVEYRVRHKAGHWVYLEDRGIIKRDERGEAGHIIGFSVDITERKKAEHELEELLRREQEARQEAEEASRLKDDFLATVSHELRTPLNAIIGWSHILSTGEFNEKDISRAIDTIYRNAKSQAQIIEDILDVSRIITGKIRLDIKPISLGSIIQSAVESLRPAIDAKHINLQMRLAYESQMIYADPGRMQQVVWNLLSNAVKFTPEKGQVIVELSSTETHTKIVVSDNGKGISPHFLPHVFERFRQADSSTTRNHGGLGLGLAIVRHIVELHGGTVEVRSHGENQGAAFTVQLPLSKSAPDRDREEAIDNSSVRQTKNNQLAIYQSSIKGLRILLLDDETDTLELLSVALTMNGASVKTQTTVRDALEMIKQWQPDVIISDIAMPEEDGFLFIKKLRELPPEQGGKIPAIALTAYVGIRERTEVLSSGFQMYVPKPVEPSELLEAVASLMNKR